MKPPSGMVFIYGLTAEGEGIRYIGVTKHPLQIRLKGHWKEVREGKINHKCRWMRACRSQNREVKIIEIVCVPEQNWEQWERDLISRALESGACNLTNSCSGGRGVINPSAELRARNSASNKGKTVSAETRAKTSAANRGRVPTLAARIKMSAAQRKRMERSSEREKIASKLRGQKQSDATKSKRSAHHIGTKRSIAAKARISEGLRLAWARKRGEIK